MGNALLSFVPKLMKSLTYIGTLAMFLVGGGIILHGIPSLAPIVHSLESLAQNIPKIGSTVNLLVPSLLGASVGIVLGAILVTAHGVIDMVKVV
jgi:predicted DNA repair protein MutK